MNTPGISTYSISSRAKTARRCHTRRVHGYKRSSWLHVRAQLEFTVQGLINKVKRKRREIFQGLKAKCEAKGKSEINEVQTESEGIKAAIHHLRRLRSEGSTSRFTLIVLPLMPQLQVHQSADNTSIIVRPCATLCALRTNITSLPSFSPCLSR